MGDISTNQVPFQEKPIMAERDAKLIKMYATGFYSYTTLARIFKITSQRVGQIIKKSRKEIHE